MPRRKKKYNRLPRAELLELRETICAVLGDEKLSNKRIARKINRPAKTTWSHVIALVRDGFLIQSKKGKTTVFQVNHARVLKIDSSASATKQKENKPEKRITFDEENKVQKFDDSMTSVIEKLEEKKSELLSEIDRLKSRLEGIDIALKVVSELE
tara:strand:+ start:316 stop:780 length:465 start_codon:yes stop_codon:yes gene_type:complete